MKGFLNLFFKILLLFADESLKNQEMATKYAFLHYAKSHSLYVDFDIKSWRQIFLQIGVFFMVKTAYFHF